MLLWCYNLFEIHVKFNFMLQVKIPGAFLMVTYSTVLQVWFEHGKELLIEGVRFIICWVCFYQRKPMNQLLRVLPSKWLRNHFSIIFLACKHKSTTGYLARNKVLRPTVYRLTLFTDWVGNINRLTEEQKKSSIITTYKKN